MASTRRSKSSKVNEVYRNKNNHRKLQYLLSNLYRKEGERNTAKREHKRKMNLKFYHSFNSGNVG